MNMTPNSPVLALRESIRILLQNPNFTPWTVMGLGMMRAYFGKDKRYRLHLWNRELAIPNVSTLHDHPWDLTSWILSGIIVNSRFELDCNIEATPYNFQTIKCGEQGGPVGVMKICRMRKQTPEYYKVGDSYGQLAEEIHDTGYSQGAITFNDRSFRADAEHARVFWPRGEKWVSAEPRPATCEEIERTVSLALASMERD